jgi:sulfite reductase (NADPH) flavoprotein alpha-component
MLIENKMQQLRELVNAASKEELIWINGYLAGLLSNEQPPAAATVPVKAAKITLVYGTETGNSKKLANTFAANAKKQGVGVKLQAIDQYRLTDLAKEEYFFLIISTQGDGEPPNAALRFFEYIHQDGLSLKGLKYSVLALGDSAYPLFCKAGADIDARLHQSGAEAVVTLQCCDTDYEAIAADWFTRVLQAVEQSPDALPATNGSTIKPAGKKYYEGTVIGHINLNDRGSGKQTFHVEIAVEETVDYEPGDSLGIVPNNKKEVVQHILQLSGADAGIEVTHPRLTATLSDLLEHHLSILYLPERIIRQYATLVQQDIPDTRMDLSDLLRIYPVKDTAQFIEVVKFLDPIAPRLYSIASSPNAHGNEVHITVALHHFNINEEKRVGLCSDYIAQFEKDTPLKFYISRNNGFKLPDADKDIIMIGPGTGVAPFRSFVAERDATGAAGRNWLFFGEQHFVTDFLYQTEWQTWLSTGVLSRISLAFSRDQAEKIYVQHRLQQEGAEVVAWLEDGASLYICGAKHPMSDDVEQTLLQIIQQHKNISAENAQEYLNELKESGRYEKDVY